MMLPLSYAVAAAAMSVAASYLVLRLRFYITTTTMLVGSLLLVYGPVSLSFTLSSGNYGFLVRPWMGDVGLPPSMFPVMRAKVGDLDPIIAAVNFSLALMYLGIILGIEAINRFLPAHAFSTDATLESWGTRSVENDVRDHGLLLGVISALFLLMLFYSIKENHIGTIEHFFSIKDDNTARNLFRARFSGSPSYLYRVALGAVAPMFVIWGLLAGISSRSRTLLVAVFMLFLITMVGKIDTLSKAPPAFFVVQIMLAGLLTRTNKVSWRIAVAGAAVLAIVIYVTTRLIVIFPPGVSTIAAVYSRVFEVENETLVENFAVFPHLHPFMWGTNLRPIATLMGVPYEAAYNIVGYIWYDSHDITSPSLFIADAWADFSYAGVFLFSVFAGATCRILDIAFLSGGKSAASIAVLAATSLGILTLLTTALNIALFSGGLLLAPLLAGAVMLAGRRLNRAT